MIRRSVVFLITLYQRLISPLFAPRCRFYPSCSEYAKEVVTRHGVLKGGGLAVWRLLRCGPWTKGGFDPAP
jgi:uncharacterized protein